MPDDDNDAIKFTPKTNIDPNSWYHITENRVDTYDREFTSNFQLTAKNELAVWPLMAPQMWQFHPVNASIGRYSLRLSMLGVYKQLGVCYEPKEVSKGKTKPCMTDSVPGEEAQMWDIGNWGNDTYRFINVRNGTDFWLDVHSGNPPFMADDIDTGKFQPAQRWLMTSASNVDDKTYSTVFSAEGIRPSTPKTTGTSDLDSEPTGDAASEPRPTSSIRPKESQGISSGAAAGIAVAASIVVIGLALLIFFLFRRRSRRRAAAGSKDAAGPNDDRDRFTNEKEVPSSSTSEPDDVDQAKLWQRQRQATWPQYPPRPEMGGHGLPYEMNGQREPQEMAPGVYFCPELDSKPATARYS